jgi:tetratricopeptide (TPR) repeat protein
MPKDLSPTGTDLAARAARLTELAEQINNSRSALADLSGLISVMDVYNVSALVQYHYGDSQRAESLCKKAIEICARWPGFRSTRWLSKAMQPYINLARLAAAQGRLSESVDISQDLYDYFESGAVSPSRTRIVEINLRQGYRPSSTEVRDIYRGYFVADVAKAYLDAREHSALFEFARSLFHSGWMSERQDLQCVILEATAKASLFDAEYGTALKTLGMIVAGRIAPIVATLSAQAKFNQGDQSAAIQQLRSTAADYRQWCLRARYTINARGAWRVLWSICMAQLQLTDFRDAATTARALDTLALCGNDEVAIIRSKAIRLLSSILAGSGGPIDGCSTLELSNLAQTHHRVDKILVHAVSWRLLLDFGRYHQVAWASYDQARGYLGGQAGPIFDRLRSWLDTSMQEVGAQRTQSVAFKSEDCRVFDKHYETLMSFQS